MQTLNLQTTNSSNNRAARHNASAQFWDKIAQGYARRPVADPAAFERKIAITKEHMTQQDVVLDVGCGTGSLALILAPFAKHVHGFDVSGEMIRIARGKAEAQNASNVTFHCGEFENGLPFQPESLDGICAYSLLHLLEDPLAALVHIRRFLKPGGFFVASTVCLAESWVPYRPILRVMRWVGKAPYVNILSEADMLRYLNQAGFVDVRCPDVGAQNEVVFTVARKPSSSSIASEQAVCGG